MSEGAIKGFSRYVRLDGAFFMRKKTGRSGAVPHYLVQGVDAVSFDSNGEPRDIVGAAMAVEVGFNEVKPPVGLPRGKDTLLIVQLVAGGKGYPATPSEAKMLDELGRVLDGLISKRQRVVVIAAPYSTAEQYGMASGRFAPIGIFDEDERPIWLHPTAIADGVLKCPWPGNQVCRGLSKEGAPEQGGAPASGPIPGWYTESVSVLSAKGLTGDRLMLAACQGQGAMLHAAGVAPSLEAGVELAKAELLEGLTKVGVPAAVLAPAPVPAKAIARKPGEKGGTKSSEPAARSQFGGNVETGRNLLKASASKKK